MCKVTLSHHRQKHLNTTLLAAIQITVKVRDLFTYFIAYIRKFLKYFAASPSDA
jgi:hypothetical protein